MKDLQILCESFEESCCIQSDKWNSFFITAKMSHSREDISTAYMGSSCPIKRIFGYSYPFSVSLLRHPLKSTWSLPVDFNRISLFLARRSSVTAPAPSCTKGLSGTKIKGGKPRGSSINRLCYNPQPRWSAVRQPQPFLSEATNIPVYVGCFQSTLFPSPPYVTCTISKSTL